MSVVWVYWAVPAQGDELKFSIRSVAQYVSNVSNLLVCGDKPDWFFGEWIPSPKFSAENAIEKFGSGRWHKEIDSIVKLRAIIDDERVTQKFLWMYDDTFIMRPCSIDDIAVPRCGGNLCNNKYRQSISGWREARKRTALMLEARGFPAKNYSTHYPVVFDKQRLLETIETFRADQNPVVIESLYQNHWAGQKVDSTNEVFEYWRSPLPDWNPRRETFVINVGSITPRISNLLQRVFPDQSPAELPAKETQQVKFSASKSMIYLPTVPWSDLFQFPQQLCRQFAANDWSVYYCDKTVRSPLVVEDGITLIPYESASSHVFDIKMWSQPNLASERQFSRINAQKSVFCLLDSMPRHKKWEANSFRKADMTLVSSARLAETRKQDHGNIKVFRNAVPASYIEQGQPVSNPFHEHGKPVVFFSGYVGPWVDVELLQYLGQQFKVVVAGRAYHRDRMPRSVEHIGMLKWEELYSHYYHADVGIIPFRECEEAEFSSPVKLYEYLGAGLPVVGSTSIAELSEVPSDLIWLPQGKEEWVAAIREAASVDRDDYREIAQAFVQRHTWESRYQELMEWIQ